MYGACTVTTQVYLVSKTLQCNQKIRPTTIQTSPSNLKPVISRSIFTASITIKRHLILIHSPEGINYSRIIKLKE